jgi:hypothetical protein
VCDGLHAAGKPIGKGMVAYTESKAERKAALDRLSIHNCMVNVDTTPSKHWAGLHWVSTAEFRRASLSKFNLVNLLLNGINARYDRAR